MTIPMWTDDPVRDAERWEQYKSGKRRRNQYLPNEIDDEEEDEDDGDII